MFLPISSPLIPETIRGIFLSIGYSGTARELGAPMFVLLTILSWPIARSFRMIDSANIRMLLTTSVGLLTCIILYGFEVTTMLMLISLMLYAPCRYRLFGPGTISVFAICIMGYVHYEFLLNGSTTIDSFPFTSTLMIIVAKICMFGYHVYDGDNLKKKVPLALHAHVSHHRKVSAITEFSLFSYMAYLFEFMGGLIGSVTTYREFSDFMHLRGDFSNLKKVSFARPSVFAIGRAFTAVGLYGLLMSVPAMHIDVLISDWSLSLPFVYRVVLCCVICTAARLVFVAAWSLTEVNFALSGFAYQPKVIGREFNRGTNIEWFKVESSQNFNSILSHWNMRLGELWLKNCVYERVETGHSRMLSNLLTKVTSAVWHGWLPGYYFQFLTLGLGNFTDTIVRKRLHPRLPHKLLKHSQVLAWLHTWMSLNFFYGPFRLLTFEKTVKFGNAFYWWGIWYHFAIIGVLMLLPVGKTRVE